MDSQLEWMQKLGDAFLAQQKDTKDAIQRVRAKTQQPPESYWYYCPSARAYYPTAPACPEPWIKVHRGRSSKVEAIRFITARARSWEFDPKTRSPGRYEYSPLR